MIDRRKIAYSREAIKILRRMPAGASERIVAKIELYADDPSALANNVKAMSGSEFVRLRVGDWRIIMDDRGNVLHVLKVGPRGGIYG